jgi:hypothetical protein
MRVMNASRRSVIVGVVCLTLAAAALLTPNSSRSADSLDGRAIMERVDAQRRSDTMYAEGSLVVERRDKVLEKSWRNRRTGWGETMRSLLQFTEPAEVRGVSLLTVQHRDSADEQWLYAPAIDRVRRIAAREKSTRFIGTDFTYEDMQERDLEAFRYRLVGEGDLDGTACYRVEARPHSHRESHYSRLLFHVAKRHFVLVGIEGFVAGELRRRFRASDLRRVEGVLTTHRWVVEDLKRRSRTTLTLRGVRYDLPIPDDLFTTQGMRVLRPAPSPKGP